MLQKVLDRPEEQNSEFKSPMKLSDRLRTQVESLTTRPDRVPLGSLALAELCAEAADDLDRMECSLALLRTERDIAARQRLLWVNIAKVVVTLCEGQKARAMGPTALHDAMADTLGKISGLASIWRSLHFKADAVAMLRRIEECADEHLTRIEGRSGMSDAPRYSGMGPEGAGRGASVAGL